MIEWPWALLAACLSGLLVAFGAGPILRRLPEPAPEVPDADTKIGYAQLARPRFLIGCALLSAAAALIAWLRLPLDAQPAWAVLATLGVLLAAIDGVTTWIPGTPTRIGWLLMLVAAVGSLGLGSGWGDLLRGLAGAAIAWLLYFLFSLPAGGLAFGDVRFAPLIGAAAGLQSWTLLFAALALGTLVGGIFGLYLLLRKRRGGLPYAPSMLIGAFLAPLIF